MGSCHRGGTFTLLLLPGNIPKARPPRKALLHALSRAPRSAPQRPCFSAICALNDCDWRRGMLSVRQPGPAKCLASSTICPTW